MTVVLKFKLEPVNIKYVRFTLYFTGPLSHSVNSVISEKRKKSIYGNGQNKENRLATLNKLEVKPIYTVKPVHE